MADEEAPAETYEGERNDASQRHGSGSASFANGDTYAGGYESGQRSGAGVYTSSASTYTGSYAANLRDGAGVMAYADEGRYEGSWLKGYRHGEGVYDFPNGDYYEGSWAAGAKHGVGVYFFAGSMSQFHGYWELGCFLGGTWTHQDGTVFVSAFAKAVDVGSLPSGRGTYYTSSGNAQSVVFAGSRWTKLGGPQTAARSSLPVLLETLGLACPQAFAAMKALAPGMIVPPPRVIVCGAPASGKGEQCEKILHKYGMQHISTGDVIRQAIKAGSELGREAQAFMLAGQSVPDEILTTLVVGSLNSEACQEFGWMLDGFPRTQAQAQALKDAGVAPSLMLVLDVSDEDLIAKSVNRRLDPETGEIYDMLHSPPPEGDVADRVITRKDDSESVVQARIHSYHEAVEGVAGVFTDVVRSMDAFRDADVVFEEVCMRMDGVDVPPRVVLLGAPASGKGALADMIVEKYGVTHVSPAGVLRAAIQAAPPNEEHDAAKSSAAALQEEATACGAIVEEKAAALAEAEAAAAVPGSAEGEEPAEVPAEAAEALATAQAAMAETQAELERLQGEHATATETLKGLRGPLLDAVEHMSAGETVPDDLLMPLMVAYLQSDEIRSTGWLLDGFPRTAAQVDALAAAKCGPHVVLLLDCPDELVIERIEGRRLDPETGTIYHMQYSPPEDEEVEARLVQRKDDRREVVQASLDKFHASASSVTGGAFSSRVRRVDSSRSEETIAADICSRIEGRVIAPKLVVAGAPGSGKGAHCEWLIKMLGVEHVTTGGVLREAITAGTDAGLAAQAALAEMGEVPDDVLLPMLFEKLKSPETAASGWLLDGFPRTAEQATAMQAEGLSPDSLVVIDVPQQILLEQATQRRFDPETGEIYNLTTNPPPRDPEIEGRLVTRSSDKEEVVLAKLGEYAAMEQALSTAFGGGQGGALVSLDGTKDSQDMTQQLVGMMKLRR